MIYFLKGFHLRLFGFPRLTEGEEEDKGNNQKDYKWKKTNFVTDLPKHKPMSRYLVGQTRNKEDIYFMHVSVLGQGMPYLI
jgi:hypothetical protein